MIKYKYTFAEKIKLLLNFYYFIVRKNADAVCLDVA